MKQFFSRKKYIKILSAFLACCMLAGAVGMHPMVAYGSEEIPLSAQGNTSVFNIQDVAEGSGKTVEYVTNGSIGERVFYGKVLSAIHMEIDSIVSGSDDNYSFVMAIGNNTNQWWDKTGYMLMYGSEGHFEIFQTKAETWWAPGSDAAIVEVKREELGTELDVDIKISGDSYIVTVNGATYTLPILGGNNFYVSLGMAGDVDTTGNLADYNAGAKADSSFVVSNVSETYQATDAPTAENLDEMEVAKAEQLMMIGNDSITYDVADDNGVKVTYHDTYQGWERIGAIKKYSANKGIHVEVRDIATPQDAKYSFMVSFGNVGPGQWYDKLGYMLVYNNAGDFVIHAMQGSGANIASTPIAVKREVLGNELTLDIKLQDDNYIITVNEKSYTIPAKHHTHPYGDTDNLSLAFGISESPASGIPWKNFTDASYKITKLGEWIENTNPENPDNPNPDNPNPDNPNPENPNPEDPNPDNPEPEQPYEPTAVPDYLVRIGDHFEFTETTAGLDVKHHEKGAAWERFCYIESYEITDDGVELDIKNIVSESDNYSLAIGLSSNKLYWYNQKGIMILYSKSGNLAVIGTTGEKDENGKDVDPNNAEVLVYDKVEYKDSLTVNFKHQDETCLLTINGKEYIIDSKWFSNASAVYHSLGIMSDYVLQEGDISELQYWQEDFKDKSVSFTIAGITIGKPYEPTTVPDYIERIGDHFEYTETDTGLIATHHKKGEAWERFWYKNSYLIGSEGLELDIRDITSESDNYTLAIGLSNQQNYWYNKKGIMLLYGKSGNLAIIGTTGVKDENGNDVDPNNAKVLAYKTVEYKDSLLVNIKQQDGKYVLTINGSDFTIDGEWLSGSKTVYYAFGIMSDYVLKDGDVSELQYWQSGFKNKNVSFRIAAITEKVTPDEPITGTSIKPEDVGMSVIGENVVLQKAQNGVKVIHGAKAGGWERVSYLKSMKTTGNGIRIEIKDIASKAEDYSLAIALGNNYNQWCDKNGYMIIYGKNGDFSIIATNPDTKDPNMAPVVLSEVREALGDSLTLDIKLKGDNFIITANGKTYTISAKHKDYPINNPKGLIISYGIIGGGKLGNIDFHSNNFKRNNVSFVIAEATDEIDLGKDFDLIVTGYNWKLEKAKKGTKVTHSEEGAGWERISLKNSYKTTEGGLCIELVDIQSKDENYSLAVMLGNVQDPWYDCTGYMIIYGKSGNFSIIATDSSIIDPNQAPTIVSEVREPLGSTLSINVRLTDIEYIITVNGKEYHVPSEHVKYPLSDTENLYVSFGELSDGELGSVIYNTDFKKNPLSFTIASVYHSDESVVEDEKKEEVKEEPVTPEKDDVKQDQTVAEKESVNVVALVCIGATVVVLVALIIVMIFLGKRKKAKGGIA